MVQNRGVLSNVFLLIYFCFWEGCFYWAQGSAFFSPGLHSSLCRFYYIISSILDKSPLPLACASLISSCFGTSLMHYAFPWANFYYTTGQYSIPVYPAFYPPFIVTIALGGSFVQIYNRLTSIIPQKKIIQSCTNFHYQQRGQVRHCARKNCEKWDTQLKKLPMSSGSGTIMFQLSYID